MRKLRDIRVCHVIVFHQSARELSVVAKLQTSLRKPALKKPRYYIFTSFSAASVVTFRFNEVLDPECFLPASIELPSHPALPLPRRAACKASAKPYLCLVLFVDVCSIG